MRFLQVFLRIRVSFLPCVLVSQLNLYQNEDVCVHLQVLNHNCVPDANISCTHLGGEAKGCFLGG